MTKPPYPRTDLTAMARHPLLKIFWSRTPEILEQNEWPDCVYWQRILEQEEAWQNLPARLQLFPEIKMGQRRKRKLAKQKSAADQPTLRRYESSIIESCQIPMRESNLHDYFNTLIWLQFPNAKYALHHCAYRSYQSGLRQLHGNLRNDLTDALTRFDEGGLVYFANAEEDTASLRELFRRGTDEDKAAVAGRHERNFAIFGHGLLEVWSQGGRRLTAGVLVVDAGPGEWDHRLAAYLHQMEEPQGKFGTLQLEVLLGE